MSEEQAGQFLLEQCVTSREGQEKPSLDWVIETMLDKDRLAEILLQMACDQCGHTWSQLFDIVSFINRELDDYLSNLLQQIHVLACTYGWSEQQILALSAQRRAAYLEMVMA